jgi:hypothetical protein
VSTKFVSVAVSTMSVAMIALYVPGMAMAAPFTSEPPASSLPPEVSAGETQPPPESTEVQHCTTSASGEPVPTPGETSEPQITKIEGGGKKYSYQIPGLPEDEYLTVSEPPKGFEPMKASDAELEIWGFPPRPPHESELERWRELVGSYREAVVSPGCTEPKAANTTVGEWVSPNWSGYVAVQENNPYKWHAVIGEFYEAANRGPSCNGGAQVSQWVGMGGVYSGRFIQTGTTLNTAGAAWAWIEFYAGQYHPGQYVIPNFPVSEQNLMQFYAGYNLSLQTAYFYATNVSTGQTILTQTVLGPQFYDGSSAEWITEAPYVVGNGPEYERPLLNYGEITWWNNTAQNEANEVLPIWSLQDVKVAAQHKNRPDYHWPSRLWNWSLFSDYYYLCE